MTKPSPSNASATDTIPLSEERMRVYEQRAAAKQPLHSKNDINERDGVGWRVSSKFGKTELVAIEVRNDVTEHKPRPLGSILRILRRKSGLSVRGLMERSGVGYSHISRIESLKLLPSLKTLQRLAKGLQVSIRIDTEQLLA